MILDFLFTSNWIDTHLITSLCRFIWFVFVLDFGFLWNRILYFLATQLSLDEKSIQFAPFFTFFALIGYFFGKCDAFELQSTLLNCTELNKLKFSKNEWYLIISKWFFYWTISSDSIWLVSLFVLKKPTNSIAK